MQHNEVYFAGFFTRQRCLAKIRSAIPFANCAQKASLSCDCHTHTVASAAQISGPIMSINKQSEIAANLQIGPTDQGMVRIYVETPQSNLPLDFEPEEALEIAEELKAAAMRAQAVASK